MELLQIYRELEGVYASMAQAAGRQDWDHLTSLQEATKPLVQALSRQPSPATLGAQGQQAVAGSIRRIQAHESTVRSHVDPWMTQARQQLGSAARERRVQSSYGQQILGGYGSS
jgi:hypothetical protein